MKIEALVKMANEISYFYDGESGKEAPAAVATHLRRYWEPRMRMQIVAHYDQNGGDGLDEVAKKAVGLLAAEAHAGGTATNAAS